MSLFVSSADYAPKHRVVMKLDDDGVAVLASKKAQEPNAGTGRSQVELAATRAAKFVPSIIIIGYSGLCNLVNSKNAVTAHDQRHNAFIIVFWFCFVLTPVFIAYFDRKNQFWLRWMNVAVGTVAFPIWAYAFPCGWFVEIGKYDPVWAGMLLMGFSIVTALMPPPKLDET
jgi:hypothetical protein